MTTSSNHLYTSTPPKQVVRVLPEPDSRLEHLASQYDELKKLAEEAAQRLADLKDAVKAELAAAAPGAEKVVLDSDLLDQPLQMSARSEWRIDSKKLKAEHPETWVRYAKRVESWRLDQIR